MKNFKYVNSKSDISNEDNIIFTTANSDVLSILKKGKFKIIPIIPDASQYVRDMNKYGIVGMGIRKVLRLGPIKLFKLGLFGLPKAHKVLKKDFRRLLEMLLYVELLDFKRYKPKFVFLHPQITDLALANENKDLLESFTKLVRKSGSEPGLASRNIGHLLKRLNTWNLNVNYVLAPVNKKGFMMFPSKKVCEELIKGSKNLVIFADFSQPGSKSPNKDDLDYLRKLKIRATVV